MDRAPIDPKTDRDHPVKDLKTFKMASDSVSLCVFTCSRYSMYHC